MNRREALKLFGKTALFATTFSSKFIQGMASSQSGVADKKLVLIYDSASSSSPNYNLLIQKAGPYLSARDSHWLKKLTIWDIQIERKQAEAFIKRYGANTDSMSFPILVSVPDTYDVEPEVELWTVDWLEYNDTFDLDGCYPISGGWWSVEGDWNPTIKKVRDHLYTSPNHSKGKFQLPWLETLKFEELQSLHSDHHREMTKKGKVYWQNVNVECPAIGM